MQSTLRLAATLAMLTLAGCAAHRHEPQRPTDTLYLAGSRPGTLTVVNLRGQRAMTRHLRELSPGDPLYFLTATGGRLVAYGHDHTYSFGPAGREPGRSLGESWFFVPSATPGRVWLALLANPRTLTLRSLREVTVRGTTTVARTPKPPAWPIAALNTGLVIQRKTLELWNPHSGTIRPLPGVFPMGARGSVIASCDDPCPVLHVTDTKARTPLNVRPPAGVRFVATYAHEAFSPDGGQLAVPARTQGGRSRVAVVDIQRRTARLLPGASLATDYPLITWAHSGWLYFHAARGRIGAYHPGERTARILPFRARPFVDLTAA